MHRSIIVTAFILLVSVACMGQDKYTISFNATGKIQPSLPEKIGTTDFLGFKINDPTESFDQYKKNLKDRISKSLQRLTKLLADAEKKKVLELIFGITEANLTALKTELENVLADPMYNGALVFTPVFKAGDKKYYHISLDNTTAPSSDDFEPNTVSTFLGVKPVDSEKDLDFALTKTDPFAKLVLDWLNSTKVDYPTPIDFTSFRPFKKDLHDLLPTITGFLNRVRPRLQSRNGVFVTGDIPFLNNLIDSARILTTNLASVTGRIGPAIKLQGYKNWILKWLWYQNSEMPQMNPFPFKTEKDLGEEADTSALAGLRFKIAVREDFYKTANLNKFNVRQLDSLINETDSLKKRLADIQKASQQYSNAKGKNDKAILSLGSTISHFNTGILFASDPNKKLYWMRHHDASANYQLLNNIEKSEYTEDDRVLILGHNLKPNEKSEIHISFQDITNDASQLSEQIQKVLAQIAPLAQKLLPIPAANTRSNIADRLKLTASDAVADLADALEVAQKLGHCLDYLITQINPVLDVQQVTDKSSSYHSQLINPAKKIEGPKKATYYLNTATTNSTSNAANAANAPVADTFTYRINKLYRIFPMAGLNYALTNFSDVSIDSATHLSKINSETHAHFIVGIKWFIKKEDIRNPRFIWQSDDNGKRLFLSRTSVNLAFSISKPLNNIYTGFGFDIVPGFCLNLGSVFNKYSYNRYFNEQTIQSKTLYRTGFYVGTSTDISLFTDIAKLLNL